MPHNTHIDEGDNNKDMRCDWLNWSRSHARDAKNPLDAIKIN